MESPLPTNPTPPLAAAAPSISILIPVWNESEALWENCHRWLGLPGVREIILAVAGQAKTSLDRDPRIRILHSPEPNRGLQQKLAAEAAAGDVLLFHHADSELRAEHTQALLDAMQDANLVGGAYVRAFDDRHPYLKWLQRLAAWQQEHWGALYGDQSIFVRRAHYERMGGFAPIPLMEDVEFSRRLRASGRIAMLTPPLATSARRHVRHGSWRTSLRNGLLLVLYRFGVSPFRLHRWYYHDLARHSILTLIWRELICGGKPATPSPAPLASPDSRNP